MSNHISISGTATPINSKIRLVVNALQTVVDDLDALNATLAQINADGQSSLAEKTGLSAADAADVVAVLASAGTELHGAFISQALSRFG